MSGSVHGATVDLPWPERLEGAACDPIARYLAHLGMHAAHGGASEAYWYAWVHAYVPDVSEAMLAETAACMRSAGLWPWRQ